MNAEIITIGDELLIGQTVDTNSAWIGRELTKLGLIETRFFSGERGRGGRIQKIRICMEKKEVKQIMHS